MRILFTTVGLPGHFFPLVPLAWACRARGHEVLVATTEDFRPTVLRAGLPACSWSRSGGIADVAATDRVPAGERRFAHGRAFARIARRSLSGAEEVLRSWRPDLVVSERAELAGPIVAAAGGVPRAELHWGAAELPEYRAAWEAEWEAEGGGSPFGAADVVLNPWPPSLRAEYAESHRSIRHVAYNGDASVPGWLVGGRHPRRVCLTFGTLLPHLGSRDIGGLVLPLLRRLGSLDVELVVAIDDRVAATWPALPGHVRHAGRLPLAEVMSTCTATIHHAGQGTSLTALAAACPQVMIPQFDDQFDNAETAAKGGTGIVLLPEETTTEAIYRACRTILESQEHRTAAARIAAEIAAQSSPADVAASLEDRF
ncbi:nucleotide disphospho-sugar-binding domain-containing protein [Amycolatopsis sp. NPDC021455]|uniref:nucleotide disphospho-sugar-binding domain-containing protein n=1 Tax=Amycolatopsis sp. NPDC021455 TaxID=3154901 RepID=UPI0033E07906